MRLSDTKSIAKYYYKRISLPVFDSTPRLCARAFLIMHETAQDSKKVLPQNYILKFSIHSSLVRILQK